MRTILTCAALALALGSAPAFAQSGEITIWSWNVAASSLKATIEGFNKQFPDIKVTVQD
ncbi:MAG: ABC transporter substrate-binding protein, partial [Mesorhizobium sp.]